MMNAIYNYGNIEQTERDTRIEEGEWFLVQDISKEPYESSNIYVFGVIGSALYAIYFLASALMHTLLGRFDSAKNLMVLSGAHMLNVLSLGHFSIKMVEHIEAEGQRRAAAIELADFSRPAFGCNV